MRRLVTGWLWVVCACLMIGCAPRVQSQEFVARNPITYGLTLQPSGFDPHIHASSELGIPLRQVYDTLIYRDPTTGEFVPGLATAWSISDDGLVYTFSLRQGVTFHDGEPFNAQAVAANLDRITNPMVGSQKALFLLGSYAGYEIVDDFTIRLILSEPYSPLLDSLSQVYLGIASPKALNEYSTERYQFYQVGTGPFEFVEYVPGDRLVIRRNFDYAWGPAFYEPITPESVDEVTFRFFTDPATRALALESGDADVMGELLPIDARALSANNNIQIIPVTIPGQPLQFMMNTQQFPTDRLDVRQAILYATNRDAIIDAVFQRFSPVAWGALASNVQFATPDVVGAYAYDPAQARALLANTGFEDSNNDGYLDFGGVELTVNMIVPSWGLIPDTAQLIQAQLREVGIRVVFDPVPSRNLLFERVAAGNYNLVAWYEFGADPSFLNRYFTSTGDLNWTQFSTEELDGLLREAVRQFDPNARRSLYTQAQRTIMQQALLLPIRDYVNLNGVNTRLEGLTYDAYGWFPVLPNVRVVG